jgi:hypothetical protein
MVCAKLKKGKCKKDGKVCKQKYSIKMGLKACSKGGKAPKKKLSFFKRKPKKKAKKKKK